MYFEYMEAFPLLVDGCPEHNIEQYKKSINYWEGNNMFGDKNEINVEYFKELLKKEECKVMWERYQKPLEKLERISREKGYFLEYCVNGFSFYNVRDNKVIYFNMKKEEVTVFHADTKEPEGITKDIAEFIYKAVKLFNWKED